MQVNRLLVTFTVLRNGVSYLYEAVPIYKYVNWVVGDLSVLDHRHNAVSFMEYKLQPIDWLST